MPVRLGRCPADPPCEGSPSVHVEIGLLGPVTLMVDGRNVSAGRPLQRAVLTALAIRCPNVCPRTELITMLWGDRPPASAAGNVQTYIANLRRALEPDRPRNRPSTVLTTAASGYQLRLAPDVVDAHRFTARADAGFGLYADGHDDAAITEFEAAMRCWRGPAFTDVPGPFARTQRNWYTERVLDVLEAWSTAKVRLAQYDDVVEPLRQATTKYPLRERLALNLIEALAGCGHTAEALAVCAQSEWLLSGELGIEPGPEFAALRARLLGHAVPSPVWRSAPETPTAPPKPAQLPHDVSSFVGRSRELALLHRLASADPDDYTAPRVAVLHGEGGSGKTALATHFGLRIADRFPDGQLYVDLRGFGPDQQPMTAEEALAILLRAVGVPAENVPPRLDQRQGYLRTLLADTRTLLVLDNAASAAQVRPLLPGSDGCFVVITSRQRLGGLVVSEGAVPIPVGVLSEREALELLSEVIGRDRVERERQAARRIAAICGLLPLPLRIAAERAAMRPQHKLAELAEELADEEQRLDVLSSHCDGETARTLFSWSYAALSPESARVFRVLGAFPGPEISIDTASALSGLDYCATRRTVRELVEWHLLEEHLPGRFRFHDLLRIYAMERFRADEPESRRKEAIRRLLDWYLQCAVAADRLLAPERVSRHLITLPPLSVSPPEFADREEALRWCEAESPNIVGIVQLAATWAHREHAWQLAHFLIPFFHLRSRWQEWIATLNIAVGQCVLLGDRRARARCEFNRTVAYQELGRYTDVLEHSARLLDSDVVGAEPMMGSFVLNNMGVALLGLGRPREAAERLEEALRREGGEEAIPKLPNVTTNLGMAYTRLGRYSEARGYLEKALALWQEADDLDGQSECLMGLGDLERLTRRHEEAACYFCRAQQVAALAGSVRYEARARHQLGRVYALVGRDRDAVAELSKALEVFNELHDATADEVRRQLRQLGHAYE